MHSLERLIFINWTYTRPTFIFYRPFFRWMPFQSNLFGIKLNFCKAFRLWLQIWSNKKFIDATVWAFCDCSERILLKTLTSASSFWFVSNCIPMPTVGRLIPTMYTVQLWMAMSEESYVQNSSISAALVCIQFQHHSIFCLKHYFAACCCGEYFLMNYEKRRFVGWWKILFPRSYFEIISFRVCGINMKMDKNTTKKGLQTFDRDLRCRMKGSCIEEKLKA